MNWYQILTATGILSSLQIIIVLLVGYILKNRFENSLAKSLELYKSSLEKELNKQKSELDTIRSRYEIQFDKFFDKKANALAEIFESLSDLKFSMSSYLSKLKIIPQGKSSEEYEREQEEEARKNYNQFIRVFHKKRIFLNKDLCKQIDDLLRVYNECYVPYSMFMSIRNDKETDRELRKESWADYLKAMNRVEKEIPKTLNEIEDSFRNDYSEIAK